MPHNIERHFNPPSPKKFISKILLVFIIFWHLLIGAQILPHIIYQKSYKIQLWSKFMSVSDHLLSIFDIIVVWVHRFENCILIIWQFVIQSFVYASMELKACLRKSTETFVLFLRSWTVSLNSFKWKVGKISCSSHDHLLWIALESSSREFVSGSIVCLFNVTGNQGAP